MRDPRQGGMVCCIGGDMLTTGSERKITEETP
jgi:hypothetical protein